MVLFILVGGLAALLFAVVMLINHLAAPKPDPALHDGIPGPDTYFAPPKDEPAEGEMPPPDPEYVKKLERDGTIW